MSATDDARRERAHRWMISYLGDERNDDEPDEQLVMAYLAGSREEAEAHADELLALRATYEGRAAFFGQAQVDFMLAESAYKDEIAALREAIKDFLCECALVEKIRKYETWQISPGSMDDLRRALDEKA